MAYKGQSVHIPCAFSIVEIVSVLYGGVMNFDPKNSKSRDKDFFVLSKGHGAMAVYACLFELAWIKDKDLDSYFTNGSLLRGLAESNIPGMHASTGSLGHGLPIAVGMAYAAKQKNPAQKVYCVVGDGEMNEGSNWEALLFAAHHNLSNLVVIVDENEFQAMGRTTEVLNLGDLRLKIESFGFEAVHCNGHDLDVLTKHFESWKHNDKPKAMVARTVKGRGVSFMEANNTWHYTRLNDENFQKAMKEIG